MTDQFQNKSAQPDANQPGKSAPAGSKHGFLFLIVAIVVVILVVIAGVVPRLRAKAALKKETDKSAVPVVDVIQPKQGAPHQEIVLPGNIQAFTDAPIYARTNGYLRKWYVDIGARVKAGQLLAVIDTPEVDQQLLQARADLNTAEANTNLSQITWNRYEDLKNTDSVSKQDVDNANGDYAAKKATQASSAANVKRLEDTKAFQNIYAPFDGVITARETDIGQLIDQGSSTTQKELFHIAAIKTLRVYINVPQQYSIAAKPGLTADLTLGEYPGRRFQGTLVRTANAIDVASRTLLVEVDVNNATGELLPGAYTEVHLKLPSDIPTFILPVSALIFRAQGLQVATVDSNNKTKLVAITLGRDFGSQVEVLSGLNGDDKVIVNPSDSVIDGEQVNPQPPKDTQQNQQGQSQPKQSGAR
ncbi:MAG TPA: efflux RND transporter periplasmic adaptor subunit [Candidatus Acidoferrales bacterium]|jgi:RND family efflux transporter MFP subunit